MSKDDKEIPGQNEATPDENEAALEMLLVQMSQDSQEEVPPLMPEPDMATASAEDELAQAMALLQQEASQEGLMTSPVQGDVKQPNQMANEDIVSPTLRDLDASRRPQQKTVCEQCPNSVWFASPEEVKCYCRVMFLTSWSTKQPNILINCDGIWLGQEE